MMAKKSGLPEFLAFHRPYLGSEEIEEVVDTLRSGWLTLGPKTARFEEKFAAQVGARFAVATSSCTAALHLSLDGLGVGPGDEVITTPYTFPSTIASILYCGAKPVLADTLPEFPNIDPDAVAAAVTSRTKVILPVHFSGAPCEMDSLEQIASRCGAAIVEDAAHALPACYKGRAVGSIGRASCFSLYAGKNITAGEGGVLTTDDGDLAAQARIKRLHGISRDAWKRYTAEGSWYYEVQDLGFKYNMTDINAAIGLHQLDRVKAFHERRLQLVKLYNDKLRTVEGLTLPRPPGDVESSWHLYVIRIDPDQAGVSRDSLIEMLKADNIGSSVHFIPAHHHPYFQERLGWSGDLCPNASRLYRGAISLPLYPAMSDGDVEAVCASLERIVEESRA